MASLEADQWVVDSELGNSPFESFAAFSSAPNRCRRPRSKVAALVEAEAVIPHLYQTWR
jgi:hypothetical protein